MCTCIDNILTCMELDPLQSLRSEREGRIMRAAYVLELSVMRPKIKQEHSSI